MTIYSEKSKLKIEGILIESPVISENKSQINFPPPYSIFLEDGKKAFDNSKNMAVSVPKNINVRILEDFKGTLDLKKKTQRCFIIDPNPLKHIINLQLKENYFDMDLRSIKYDCMLTNFHNKYRKR